MSEYLYLAHHGIKGQKWGVRRYQNPDGSYTEEGKRRYKKALTPKKRYSELSDDEVANAIKRRQNELKLDELEMQASLPIGVRYVGGLIKSGATKGVTLAVAGVSFALAKKFLKEEFDLDVPNLKK